MVKIRLQRFGKKKAPFYHIVVADSKSPRDGKIIDTDNTTNQSAKAIEHNNGDDCHTCQGQAPDVAGSRECVKSSHAECKGKTDGQCIQHPNVA